MELFKRARIAFDVLRGRITIDGSTVKCEREHVEVGQVRVKRADYNALLACNTELGVLRGAVATLETAKYEQVRRSANETLANLHKPE